VIDRGGAGTIRDTDTTRGKTVGVSRRQGDPRKGIPRAGFPVGNDASLAALAEKN